MDSSTESVRVSILGNEYSLRSDADSASAQKVAEYVRRKMTETHQQVASRDRLKVAIVSAMNMAGELFEVQARNKEQADYVDELEEKAKSLTRRISSVLEDIRG